MTPIPPFINPVATLQIEDAVMDDAITASSNMLDTTIADDFNIIEVPTTPISRSSEKTHWLTSPDIDTPMSPFPTNAVPRTEADAIIKDDTNRTDSNVVVIPGTGVHLDIDIAQHSPDLDFIFPPSTPSPSSSSKNSTSRKRLEHRRPTGLVQSHRRSTPPKALDLNQGRRERIYERQSPVHWDSQSGSASRSVSGESSVERCTSTAGILSPAKVKSGGKKSTSPNVKISSLRLIGNTLVSLKKLKYLGVIWKGANGKNKGQAVGVPPNQKEQYKALCSPRSIDSSELKGFARAQQQATECHDPQWDENKGGAGSGMMQIESNEMEDDVFASSPMPTSPMSHYSHTQYAQYLINSSSPSVVGNPFSNPSPQEFNLPSLRSSSSDAPGFFAPPRPVVYQETEGSDDAEMVPPLSPLTNSPVSISSSMRRARSKGKVVRLLGYEVREAYEGNMFATEAKRST